MSYLELSGGIWITPERLKEILEEVADYPKHNVYITKSKGSHRPVHYVQVSVKRQGWMGERVIKEFIVGPGPKTHLLGSYEYDQHGTEVK